VPILPDDTAFEVFQKVTVAAEITLWRTLPDLLAGHAPRLPNDLTKGSYFGGRKPEDGRIDWSLPAQQVYNLIRAVAPPYPGAFCDIGQSRLIVARARLMPDLMPDLEPGLQVRDNRILGVCGDHRGVWIKKLVHNELEISPAQCATLVNQSA
jgi:methionyl-tRNA formyltransferase